MLRLAPLFLVLRAERPPVDRGLTLEGPQLQPASLLETWERVRSHHRHHSGPRSLRLRPFPSLFRKKNEEKERRPLPEPKGEMKTMEDFQEKYGDLWAEKWREAKDLEERRWDGNRERAYTKTQWKDTFGWGNAKWERSWGEAAVASPVKMGQEADGQKEADAEKGTPQESENDAAKSSEPKDEKRPLPEDGHLKSHQEFLAHYGEQTGQSKWEDAEHLEERRLGSDQKKYTYDAWQKAFGPSGWDEAPPTAPLKLQEMNELTVGNTEAENSEGEAKEPKEEVVQEADREEQQLENNDSEKLERASAEEKSQASEQEALEKEKEAKEARERANADKKALLAAAATSTAMSKGAKGEKTEEAMSPDEELNEDAPADVDIPKAGSQLWSDCKSKNAHKCFDLKHCCCNVGTTYVPAKQTCVKSKLGDRDPEVLRRQIPRSRSHFEFGECSEQSGNHPCGTGCCCNGLLEWNVETKLCEEPPSSKGVTQEEMSEMSDPAPPKEDPIPGSQTWMSGGYTCEAKEAYSCGKDRSHCCCRFGCEFIESWDKCGHCKNDAPKVKQNMIPASQLWEMRVKKGVCNAKRSHPCGAGCCCNAGWTWNKEQRRCLNELGEEPVTAPAPVQSAPPEKGDEKGGKGGARSRGLAISLLLLPLAWRW